MFLTGHAAVGVLLAKATGTNNPVVAFGLGWASHYLADFFPHGDEEIGAWTKRGGHEIRRLLFVVGIDSIILLCAFTAYTLAKGFSLIMAAAIVGSAVPDVIWGLDKLRKKPMAPILEKFHDRNHNYIDIRMTAKAGLLLQSVVTTALWAYLIR